MYSSEGHKFNQKDVGNSKQLEAFSPELPLDLIIALEKSPPAEAYYFRKPATQASDGSEGGAVVRKGLPIRYYVSTADRIFGKGQWAINTRANSVRFQPLLDPATGQVWGEVCLVEVTLEVRNCLPRTAVGYAFIEVEAATTRKQRFHLVARALQKAIRTGTKLAFAQYGPVFQGQQSREAPLQKLAVAQQPATTKPAPKYITKDNGANKPTPLTTPAGKANNAAADDRDENTLPIKASPTMTNTGVNPVKPTLATPKPVAAVAPINTSKTNQQPKGVAVSKLPTDPWTEQPTSSLPTKNHSNNPKSQATQDFCTSAQRQRIEQLAKAKGYSVENGVMRSKTFLSFQVASLNEMTVAQADQIIQLLTNAKSRVAKAS